MFESIYEKFLRVLEDSFERFVQDENVNTYLQTVGAAVTTTTVQDGVVQDYIIVSGYESERGHWATVYKNEIRWGEQSFPVSSIENPMVLTPKFFYGPNHKNEMVAYRLGLVKGKANVNVFPVLLRRTAQGFEGKVLDDLCVIHTGLLIDPRTAEVIGRKRVESIKAHQLFLSCFWNIDDYLRKQNPQFYSDFDVDFWFAVEAFSERIVIQMLSNIEKSVLNEFGINPYKKNISRVWAISQVEKLYLESLMVRFEQFLQNFAIISEAQLLLSVKNLCNYMYCLQDYTPLTKLADKGINIVPYLVDAFDNIIADLEAGYSSDDTVEEIVDDLAEALIAGVSLLPREFFGGIPYSRYMLLAQHDNYEIRSLLRSFVEPLEEVNPRVYDIRYELFKKALEALDDDY